MLQILGFAVCNVDAYRAGGFSFLNAGTKILFLGNPNAQVHLSHHILWNSMISFFRSRFFGPCAFSSCKFLVSLEVCQHVPIAWHPFKFPIWFINQDLFSLSSTPKIVMGCSWHNHGHPWFSTIEHGLFREVNPMSPLVIRSWIWSASPFGWLRHRKVVFAGTSSAVCWSCTISSCHLADEQIYINFTCTLRQNTWTKIRNCGSRGLRNMRCIP